jgi:hypothetical protein
VFGFLSTFLDNDPPLQNSWGSSNSPTFLFFFVVFICVMFYGFCWFWCFSEIFGSVFGLSSDPTASNVFLMHGFWTGRNSHIFGIWAAPENIPEGGGASPPTFYSVLQARRGHRPPGVVVMVLVLVVVVVVVVMVVVVAVVVLFIFIIARGIFLLSL